jgi:hypothetical protein
MDLKQKYETAKAKLKEHAPAIIFAATTIAAVSYAIILKKELSRESERFPKGDTTYLALNKEESKEKMEEGLMPYWNIDGHKLKLTYDEPDC